MHELFSDARAAFAALVMQQRRPRAKVYSMMEANYGVF